MAGRGRNFTLRSIILKALPYLGPQNVQCRCLFRASCYIFQLASSFQGISQIFADNFLLPKIEFGKSEPALIQSLLTVGGPKETNSGTHMFLWERSPDSLSL